MLLGAQRIKLDWIVLLLWIGHIATDTQSRIFFNIWADTDINIALKTPGWKLQSCFPRQRLSAIKCSSVWPFCYLYALRHDEGGLLQGDLSRVCDQERPANTRRRVGLPVKCGGAVGCFVLSVTQSCRGDAQHQSSHIHLLTVESIFIKEGCFCTLTVVDKSHLKVETISVWRVGSFTVLTRVICLLPLSNVC